MAKEYQLEQQMKSQLLLLGGMDDLISEAAAAGVTKKMNADDLKHLQTYIDDMKRACNTVVALEKAMINAAKADSEKVPPIKPQKEKVNEKKTKEANKTPMPQPELNDDDDLDFLD